MCSSKRRKGADRSNGDSDIVLSKKALPGPSYQQSDAEKYADCRQCER